MADKTNITNIKQKMLNDLKNSLKAVNDIDIENGVNTFFLKNGYDIKEQYKTNLQSCIQYIAIKKAYNK